MTERKCALCGYAGDGLTESHLAARVNAGGLVQTQCREHALGQDRVLVQAGVERSHQHTPTDDERAWSMVVGLCGAAEMALQASRGSPPLIEALRLAPVAFGRLMAVAADPEARSGPDPMIREGLRAKATRAGKRRRKRRLCASCGRRLVARQRKWCAQCRDDPARVQRAAERDTATESGSTLDGLDRLRMALQLAPMVAREHPGPDEAQAMVLQSLSELAGGVHTAAQTVGEYPRDAEIAEHLTEQLLVDLGALLAAARTGDEADAAHAGELLGTLTGETLRALSELAECNSQVQAHAILDSLGTSPAGSGP